MNTTKGIFSHATDEWETPQDFFDELNRIYHFDLDVCATEQNAKCDLCRLPELIPGICERCRDYTYCHRQLSMFEEDA